MILLSKYYHIYTMEDTNEKQNSIINRKRSIVLYSALFMITFAITMPYKISRFTWTLYTDDPLWTPHHNYIRYHIATLYISSFLWCSAALFGIFSLRKPNFKNVFRVNIICIIIAEVLLVIDGILYLWYITEPDLLSSSFSHSINYMVFNTIFGAGIIGLGMKYCCDKCKS